MQLLDWLTDERLERIAAKVSPLPLPDRPTLRRQGLNPRLRGKVADWIAAGEADLQEAAPWPALNLSLYQRYALDGNRLAWEQALDARRSRCMRLIGAAYFAEDDRFDAALADGIWHVLEESSWSLPAHLRSPSTDRGVPDPDLPCLDLYAGETANLLVWTYALLPDALDAISPVIRRRIERECLHRVLHEFTEQTSYWWMGIENPSHPLNNWTPWITSNVIRTALHLPIEADLRLAVLRKSRQLLQAFLDHTPADGGCDEGPSYWTRAAGSFFECLEALAEVAGPELDPLFAQPRFREMGRYLLAVCLGEGWVANFADAKALALPPAQLVWRYARRAGDPELRDLALHLRDEGRKQAEASSLKPSRAAFFTRHLCEYMDAEYLHAPSAPPLASRPRVFPILQLASLEDAASIPARRLVLKGGHNGESHNHNDVGHFVVTVDHRPLCIDVGCETYRRETFRAETRYQIWTMVSDWHSVPRLGGCEQGVGEEFHCPDFDLSRLEAGEVTLEMAPAYPAEAGIASYRRRFRLSPGQPLEIEDTYAFAGEAPDLLWRLITASEVEVLDSCRLRLRARELSGGRRSAGGLLEIEHPGLMETGVEKRTVTDPRLTDVWGDQVSRICIRLTQGSPRGTLRVRILPEENPV